VTGFSPQDDNSFFGKRLDFLRDMGVPLARVAVIYGQGAVPGGEATFLETMKAVGDKQNVQIAFYPVNTTMELIDAIAHVADAVKADPTVGLVMNGDSVMGANRIVAAQEVTKRGLIATWSGSQNFADAGGLITYAPDPIPLYRRAGEYAGLILNGAKPADLPIQVATPLLTVNLKTAKAEGITIPVSILAAADRVIE
jgi:putative ABC transport system substrate-binding protein